MNVQSIEIDILEILRVLWKNAILIILSAALCGALVIGYTYRFIAPKYESDCMFYVNNSTVSVGSTNFSISSADISAAQSLVDTYIVILKSRTTMNEVVRQAGLDMTYEEISKLITAGAVNSTEVFKVTVTTTSPDLSRTIANTIATVLPDKVANIVEGSSVRIVDYAVLPTVRCSPSYSKNGAIGILIGGLIAAGIVILIHMFDDVIRSDDYLTQNFDVPVLAVIPDLAVGNRKSSYKKQKYGRKYGYGYRKYGYGYGGYGDKDKKNDTSEAEFSLSDKNRPVPGSGDEGTNKPDEPDKSNEPDRSDKSDQSVKLDEIKGTI